MSFIKTRFHQTKAHYPGPEDDIRKRKMGLDTMGK